ncbi:MAG TPA: DUF4920 domain-containing protein [Flavobacterium sp.]|jgi:hypothetical protein
MKKIVTIALIAVGVLGCKNSSTELKTETDSRNINDTISVVSNNDIEEPLNTGTAATEPAERNDQQSENNPEKIASNTDYAAFGKKFATSNVLTPAQMLSKYKSLKSGDTIAVQFKSSIKEVCKKKGCWMSMALPSEKESFVRFKDYGFFVPLNADGSEAIISGRAYVDVITVADQQHYAKDGGKTQQEIDLITEPKITYAFQADGVLIK